MRTLDLLIIDEISMVRSDVLDAIDSVLRRFREHDKPFGGVQLLMIGDFTTTYSGCNTRRGEITSALL